MMFIDRKIPGMMIGHGDYTHHTSEDTPDKVDPVEIERSEIVTLGAFLYLSDLSDAEAMDLAYLVAANGAQRLTAAARRARSLAAPDAANVMRHVTTWERQALHSILTFRDSPDVRAAIETLDAQLEAQAGALAAAVAGGPSQVQRGDDRVPVRLTRGPLDFGLPETRLPEAAAAWYRSQGRALNGTVRFELVNFVDGTRTISEIRDAVSAEFSPIPTEVVAKFFEDLVQVEVMEFRR
jgi:hypothetical protein